MQINPTLNPKQREAMNALLDHENGITEVLFGGAAGGGKCVHEDTHIYLANGQHKKIKDVLIGDEIFSVDPNYRIVRSTVKDKVFTGLKEGFKFTTPDGSVIVSKDHPFLVHDSGKTEWIKAEDIWINSTIGVFFSFYNAGTVGGVAFSWVQSIERAGVVPMYDIETEHGNFIGNNIILHNSYIGNAWLITSALTYPGTRWVMGRAVLKTIKETTLKTFFDVCRHWGIKKDVHYTFNTKDNYIRFSDACGGSEIILKDLFLYPSDPDFEDFGSLELTGAFIDEVSQVSYKARSILMSRVRYRLNDFCGHCTKPVVKQVKFKKKDGYNAWWCDACNGETKGLLPKTLYATNPTKNWAYTNFYKPAVEGRIEPYRKYIPALAGDNEFIPDEYIKSLAKLDDGDRQRLLHGNWEYDDDIATMIPYQSIIAMFTTPVAGGRKYISADIARLGRDKTVIGVWDGFILVRVEEMAKNKTNEAVDLIKKLRQEHKVPWENICIDSDGIGAGVLDYLSDEVYGIVNNSTPVKVDGEKENFGNLKSQLYFYLAKFINEGKIYVRANPKLRESITSELELVRRKDVDKDGKFWVLPKQDVKDLLGRSPDYSDMMAYRMIFEITNKSRWI